VLLSLVIFQPVCLSANDSTIKSFPLKVIAPNEVNVIIEAKITDDNNVNGCMAVANGAEGFTDVLRKPIQVIK